MPKYNHKVEADEDGIYETWTNRDGTETHGNFFSYDDDDDDDDDMPDGCKVCGNCDNYPDCREGCLD